ncbi:hypothetical protein GRX03_09550 [Halovenus sp. WSH3]|uniref:Uncharacterized protein n=1 Tax=Halovenus carboxidivorans TaxID=2692199 RepID=A0A6B0TF84_9EURY|nr:hypothetical protein [Halovenus carboxidivorans]MXR51849.1 hypothetical protein [Halovenus carboxidivorans]
MASGTAAAFEFDDSGVSDEMQVGQQETATVVIQEPFAERDVGWTLVVDSEFEDAGITITTTTVDGTTNQVSGEGRAQMTLDNEGIREVEIEVSGTVPEIQQYSYESPEQENFTALRINDSSGVIETWSVHRYTEQSREARNRLDEALEYTSQDSQDFQSAVTLYNSGEFEQATAEADSIIDSGESSEQTQTLLFAGVGVVVLLVLAGGGYYLYQQRSQNTNKLQ